MSLKGQYLAACFMNPMIGWICIVIGHLWLTSRYQKLSYLVLSWETAGFIQISMEKSQSAEGVPIIQITSSLSVIEYQGYYVYVTLQGICWCCKCSKVSHVSRSSRNVYSGPGLDSVQWTPVTFSSSVSRGIVRFRKFHVIPQLHLSKPIKSLSVKISYISKERSQLPGGSSFCDRYDRGWGLLW